MTPTAGVSSMVERVARAFSRCGLSLSEASKQELAKAAIREMREPTEEMCKLGRYATGAEPDTYADTEEAAKAVWQAMIDTALGQNPLSGT